MSRTAIIDGDIVAYKSAILNQTISGDDKELEETVLGMLRHWKHCAMAEHSFAALSCPTESGFRRTLHPGYKGNRRAMDRPHDLVLARQILRDAVDTVMYERLEADDILGIVGTNGKTADPVLVTIDKDLRQIPGWHCNPDKEDHPVFVREDEAMRHFCIQWMSGDSTDNYCGIPRVGEKKASDLLPPYRSPEEYLSITIERWNEYLDKEGLPWSAALTQARLAWILRADQWNPETGKITLVRPEKLVSEYEYATTT